MMSESNKPITEDGIVCYRIDPEETVEQATENIWNLLRTAHLDMRLDEVTLDIAIPKGHYNDKGGYTNEMYLFQKSLCLGVLPGFVDVLSFPLTEDVNTSNVSPKEAIEADMRRVENSETENAEINFDQDTDPNAEEVTAEEFLKSTDLKATYNERSNDLIWGFVEKGASVENLVAAVNN